MKLPSWPFDRIERMRATRALSKRAPGRWRLWNPQPEGAEAQARSVRAVRRWALWGALGGIVLTVVTCLPAAWVASAVASATNGRLLIASAEGSFWRGSGLLVLTGGAGSRDTLLIPSRLDWTLRPTLRGLRISLAQACCLEPGFAIDLRMGLSGPQVAVQPRDQLVGHWPAAWLTGLGTPWNTLQPGGILLLSTRALTMTRIGGKWQLGGELQVDLQQASSRLSTLAPLGSYRIMLSAPQAATKAAPAPSKLTLITLEGALQINGTGELGLSGVRFRGEARAAPGAEAALDNLLNIIGRRTGAPSIISIG